MIVLTTGCDAMARLMRDGAEARSGGSRPQGAAATSERRRPPVEINLIRAPSTR